jgi:hypothetical protein
MIKGATQVSARSLKRHFLCLKDHKGNIVV